MAPMILLLVFYHLTTFAYGRSLVPALYVFGDSLVDSGNNNLLHTIANANYLPYGVDFPSGTTGRFTNGRTVADFIAEFLGLPHVPPCVKVKNLYTTTTTGINYASGSCGILPETGKIIGECISLDDQIGLFEATVSLKLRAYFNNQNELSKHLSDSIYLFSIGSNDYLVNYLNTLFSDSSKKYTPQQFAQLLLNKLSESFKRTYNLGARKFVMFELGAIGCVPAFAKKNGKCVEASNNIANFFNNQLGGTLKQLAATLPGSKFVNGRVKQLTYDATINPSKYGLADSTNTCCTTWNNGTSSCIPWLKPCQNRDQFYYFDAFHPTESVYSIIASRCINDNSICSPTIKELVQL